MRRWLLLIILYCNAFCQAKAQYIVVPSNWDTTTQSIQISGNLYTAAKGLTNQTFIKFLRRDFFSNADKKDILNRTYALNYGGWEYQSGLQYQVKYKKGIRFSANLGLSSISSFRLNRETAQLILNGNSYYAGQMMALDKLKYYNIQWQFIGIGISGKYKHLNWQAGLQFIYTPQYTNLQLNSGNLYTETNGEYINLRLNGNYINSTAVPYSNRGFAGQAAFCYSAKNRIKWGAGVKDLGLVLLNKHTNSATLDTNIHFEGLVLTGFVLPNQSKLEDSLKALPDQYIHAGKNSTSLPALFNIYVQGFNGNDEWSAGIDYRYKAFYLPALWATYIKKLGHHGISTGLTAGGYGQFGWNLGYRYSGHHTRIGIQWRDLEGFIAPKLFSGAGIYLNFVQLW